MGFINDLVPGRRAAMVGAGAGVLWAAHRSVWFLGNDEQLRVQLMSQTVVHNGPGSVVLLPFSFRSAKIVKAECLSATEYARVSNATDASERIEHGPKVLFLGPYDSVTDRGQGLTLSDMEYALVTNSLTGKKQVVKGPAIWFPQPQEAATKHRAFELKDADYVLVTERTSGKVRVERGPAVWFPSPSEDAQKGSALRLSGSEYARVTDGITGKVRIEKGPGLWFPAPQESGEKRSAVSLSGREYIIVDDETTGEQCNIRGPQVWFPGPHDTASAVKQAIALQSDEYLVLKDLSSGRRWVQQGKALVFLEPTWQVDTVGSDRNGVRKAWVLTKQEYIRLQDSGSGKISVHRGEEIIFPGPDEVAIDNGKCTAVDLKLTEFMFVENLLTGEMSMVRGPLVWFPQPHERPKAVQSAVSLQEDEYVMLKDLSTGSRWVQRGKALVFLEPTWAIEPSNKSHVRKAWVLKKHEYVRLLDSVTGKVNVHYGEAIIFPEPNEKALDGDKLCALDLKVNEYVKILDKATGETRVAAGPSQVMLGGLEQTLDEGKQKGITVDEDHAVLVRDTKTGQLRLVTEKQMFIPGPHEKVEEVREMVRLAEHEAMIIKDKDSNFDFKYGSGEKATAESRSFFLPPYAEVVSLRWSRGPRRDVRDLVIDRIDCRSQYMAFEFNSRTKDNVDLVIEGVFFWQITDLPLMVRTTGDTPGDICQHARSQFIRHVATVDLKEFMDDINSISNKVYAEDLTFYASRGVTVHSLEVTGYKCAEASTSKVLQQIIQETTNRMNRLSQQESENEVLLFKMQGQIEQEKLKADLMSIQHQHLVSESESQGKAEAQRVAAFMDELQTQLPELSDRLSTWQTLRKKDTLAAVSQGGASLYYTPSDVDLSIGTAAK